METYYIPKSNRVNRIIKVLEEKESHVTCLLVGRTDGTPVKRKNISMLAPESLSHTYKPATFLAKDGAMIASRLSNSEFNTLVQQVRPHKVGHLYCLDQLQKFKDRQTQITLPPPTPPSGISLERRVEQIEDLLLSLVENVEKGNNAINAINAKLDSVLRLAFKKEFPDQDTTNGVVG